MKLQNLREPSINSPHFKSFNKLWNRQSLNRLSKADCAAFTIYHLHNEAHTQFLLATLAFPERRSLPARSFLNDQPCPNRSRPNG